VQDGAQDGLQTARAAAVDRDFTIGLRQATFLGEGAQKDGLQTVFT
jgi:hypothetical protein